MKSNNALIVILGTVTLDAVGIGLVMPVLPGLLRDIVHSDSIASHYGVLLALYALMQFYAHLFSGALSDRFGCRPVLLASLLGATIDYARSWRPHPSCGSFYAGRIVAGITSATGAVVGALYRRHHRWEDRLATGLRELVSAWVWWQAPWPGTVGRHLLDAPFLAAAVLNGLNLLLACFPNAGVA
ncbi:MFS transporter [Brucella pituitosa]|uniref:MFS transporter n=1 Tax=Brucella pituitosa TaxID=571256 RepID=UPI000FE1F07F|nr:MFS transporter [Brucella pituitosa]